MKNQNSADPNKCSRLLRTLSSLGLLIATYFASGQTAGSAANGPASIVRTFSAEKVATLSHEAYKVAWDANFWARRDLRFASFRPTALDWETVEYLKEITRKVPWVARDVEKHPANPRDFSKRSNELVQYDAMMLKHRFQPASFQSSTAAKIQKLIRILDEIGSCYGTSAK